MTGFLLLLGFGLELYALETCQHLATFSCHWSSQHHERSNDRWLGSAHLVRFQRAVHSYAFHRAYHVKHIRIQFCTSMDGGRAAFG